jgi:hypothetical protein
MRQLFSIFLLITVLCGQVLATVDTHSLDFDASNNQYVRDNTTGFPVGSSYNLNIAAWIKFESLSADQAFCGTDVSNNDLVWSYDVDPGRFYLQLGDPTAAVSSSVTSSSWVPDTGEWYCVAVTYTFSGGAVYFYANGSEVSHTTIGNAWRISAAGYFDVGAAYASWDTGDYTWMPFDGEIAGLVLTTSTTWDSTAITNIYNSGSVDTGAWSTLSNIVRHYTFEEGTGTTTTNGNGENTATLSGVTGTPTWTDIVAAGNEVLILVQ